MASFGTRSLEHLNTLDPRLHRVLVASIRTFDFTVLIGHRDEAAQNEAQASGRSTVRWPHSKHNMSPSLAVDLAPWPIDWADRERFTYLAGHIVGIGSHMGVPIRWGGDWDKDTEVRDNGFDDLVHFELGDP